jgi:Tfp pilus assembly protein PilE
VNAPPHRAAAGFTLVELAIVAAVLVPLLLIVGTATKGVSGAIAANDRAAEVNSLEERALGEIARVLHFGRIGTLCTQATKADVKAGLAAAVGDWFAMPARVPRSTMQLWSLTGEQQLPLQPPAELCTMEFVRSSKEKANGIDDDRNGLVDDGELRCTTGNLSTRLLGGVDLCTFVLDTGVVRVTLRYGKPCPMGQGTGVRRTTLIHTVSLRND